MRTRLLSAAPVARVPTVMRDGEDADQVVCDRTNDAEGEAPRNEPPFTVAPYGAEAWALQKKFDGALELREERLRERGAGLLPLEPGRLPKIFLRLGVQPVVH